MLQVLEVQKIIKEDNFDDACQSRLNKWKVKADYRY